ncbi:MAG: glycosyltransferase [Lachnospiraceae bacterium]|nr:glycosyltransferase [Lachnospiraceae bacterium]
MRNVTVVVPVYKDWSTLKLCIDSLKEWVQGSHQVFFINDMGPEWEDLEKRIRSAIKGLDHFHYFKNDSNLGFVKTCNRAVLELDQTGNDILLLNSDTKVTEGFLEEMSRVLYLAEKHGVVCPRSNNATLLTVPVKNNLGHLLEPEKSYGVYRQVRELLPEYMPIPTGVGFAMLIKRRLINEFGLFDEIYGRGYNEENDFCMRVNQYGYNIVMANRAFVFHYEGRSFGSAKAELDERNSAVLRERYPHYPVIVEQYFNRDMDPVDYYADLLCEGVYEKKRVLFSLYELPSAFNGTAEYGLSLLGEFYRLYKDVYDIHVLTNVMADEFFHISEKYPRVWHPHTIQGQTFHIAFAPSQIFHIEHMFILNRTCLKYTFCMQDIISLRSSYILAYDKERQDVFRKSIHFCDGMTSISQFSLVDTKRYYPDEFAAREIPDTVIYHGSHEKERGRFSREYEQVFDKYFFVFGNKFKHKFLWEVLELLKDTEHNFIFIGAVEEGYTEKNIYGYKSGNLPDEFIDFLIHRSQGILFPSLYEGFGLPILKGIEFDKKIIVSDTELNRELKEYFECYGDNILLFEESKDVKGLLDQVAADPQVRYKNDKKIMRTWKDVAVDSEAFIRKILQQEVDFKLLHARWLEMRYLENIHRCYVPSPELSVKASLKAFGDRRFPRAYGLLRRMKKQIRGEQ